MFLLTVSTETLTFRKILTNFILSKKLLINVEKYKDKRDYKMKWISNLRISLYLLIIVEHSDLVLFYSKLASTQRYRKFQHSHIFFSVLKILADHETTKI